MTPLFALVSRRIESMLAQELFTEDRVQRRAQLLDRCRRTEAVREQHSAVRGVVTLAILWHQVRRVLRQRHQGLHKVHPLAHGVQAHSPDNKAPFTPELLKPRSDRGKVPSTDVCHSDTSNSRHSAARFHPRSSDCAEERAARPAARSLMRPILVAGCVWVLPSWCGGNPCLPARRALGGRVPATVRARHPCCEEPGVTIQARRLSSIGQRGIHKSDAEVHQWRIGLLCKVCLQIPKVEGHSATPHGCLGTPSDPILGHRDAAVPSAAYSPSTDNGAAQAQRPRQRPSCCICGHGQQRNGRHKSQHLAQAQGSMG
mmetsp:Transcript_107182/g.218707  ORF Transcript_107182/g.218707 Transcript_107182/m.218707 type:complete len:315 (+) Transcript_107182:867-1811(+)